MHVVASCYMYSAVDDYTCISRNLIKTQIILTHVFKFLVNSLLYGLGEMTRQLSERELEKGPRTVTRKRERRGRTEMEIQ